MCIVLDGVMVKTEDYYASRFTTEHRGDQMELKWPMHYIFTCSQRFSFFLSF